MRDLAEHRLDDRFPPGIEMLAPLGPQGAPHPLRHRQGRRAPTARGGRPGASMTRAIRRDEGLTPQCGHRRHVRLAEIARVHARGPRHLARLGEHLGPQRLGLLLVIRLIGDLGGHDDLRRRIDGGLAVVPLDHAALRPGGRHDPALRIGKVALSRGRGDGAGRLRWTTPARPRRLAGRLLHRGRRLRLLLQDRLRRPNRLEPLLSARHLGGPLIAVPVGAIDHIVLRIGGLGLRQQRLDRRLQSRLLLHHPVVAHGFMLRGVRLDLGAIQGDMAQLDQARPLTQPEALHEQVGQRRQMLLAEVAERPKIRPLVRRQHPKRHVLLQAARNLARGRNAHGVGIEQHPHQHPGIVGDCAACHPAVRLVDRLQIQFIDQIRHEVGQVILREPVPQGGRQQQQLGGVRGAEGAGRHDGASGETQSTVLYV